VVWHGWDGYSFLKFQYAWLDNSGRTISCRLDSHLVSRENPFFYGVKIRLDSASH